MTNWKLPDYPETPLREISDSGLRRLGDLARRDLLRSVRMTNLDRLMESERSNILAALRRIDEIDREQDFRLDRWSQSRSRQDRREERADRLEDMSGDTGRVPGVDR